MDLSRQEVPKDDQLNDSWVELQFQQQQQALLGSQTEPPLPPQSIYNGMEKLLLEAQKESSNTSRASSRASPHNSPKGPHSPKSEVGPTLISVAENQGVEGLASIVQREVGTEWVWDWSSRPECIPPSDHGKQFKRPTPRHKLSVRNHGIMGLSLKSISVLLFTHACTLVVGAAAMFLFLKKPCSRCGATLALLN